MQLTILTDHWLLNMALSIYFAIIAIQFTSTLVTGSIPLQCFLQNRSFFNVFSENANVTSNARFNTLKEDAITLDKDGWFLDTKDLEYQGLDDAILEEFGFNLISNVAKVTLRTDMVITHPYKTSGTLFSIPIAGEGSFYVKIKNMQIGLIIPFDIKEVSGKKNIELKGFDYWYDVREKAEFNFSNLYYGNKELSDSMHLLMNQNWKFLSVQYGKIFIDPIANSIYKKFRNYMQSMPLIDYNTC